MRPALLGCGLVFPSAPSTKAPAPIFTSSRVAALTETEETPTTSPTTDPCQKPWREEALRQTCVHSARRACTPQACPGNDAQVQVALTFCGRGTFLPAALATGHPGAALFQAGAWGTASRGSYKGSRHLAVATGTHAPAWEPALAAGTRGLWRYWFHPGSHLRSLHLPPCPHVSLENPSPWRTANHPMTQANDRAIDPRSMDMFTRMTYALTKSKRARDQGRKRLRSILEDSAQPWRWLTLGPQQSGSRPARSLSSSASRLWKSGRPRLPGRARSY